MREVLFKAKKISDGKWVEGYYFYNANIKKHYIKTWICYYEVDPETICQYTGLKDKHGEKIWENDVALYEDDDCKFVVRFGKFSNYKNRESYMGFYADWDKYGRGKYFRKDICFLAEEIGIEVIGNIFDHAELLEE